MSQLGATLTTLNDFAEYGAVRNFVNSITSTADTTTYWLGYTDQETVSTTRDGVPANVYGTWRWLSGQVSSLTLASAFTSWRANQEIGRSSHFMKEVAADLPTVSQPSFDLYLAAHSELLTRCTTSFRLLDWYNYSQVASQLSVTRVRRRSNQAQRICLMVKATLKTDPAQWL